MIIRYIKQLSIALSYTKIRFKTLIKCKKNYSITSCIKFLLQYFILKNLYITRVLSF